MMTEYPGSPRVDGIDDRLHLQIGHLREARQSEDFTRRAFRLRKMGRHRYTRKTGLAIIGNGIVDVRGDVPCAEMTAKIVAVFRAHDVKVSHIVLPRNGRAADLGM